jgi:hypothetical protein
MIAHAADHRTVDQSLDHDGLLAIAFCLGVAEEIGDAVDDREQGRRARVGRRDDQRQHHVDGEHRPDHAVDRPDFRGMQQGQSDPAVESGRLHDGRKNECGKTEEHDRRREPVGGFGKRLDRIGHDQQHGDKQPEMPTGTDSDIHIVQAHTITASVALPLADRPGGEGIPYKMKKNSAHARKNPNIALRGLRPAARILAKTARRSRAARSVRRRWKQFPPAA